MINYWRSFLQTTQNKVKTYLGFSMKSNKIVFGYDNIKTSKKKMYCILICDTMSKKNTEKLIGFGKKLQVPVVVLEQDYMLDDLLNKVNVRAIALIDENLSKQVITELQENKMIKRGYF